LLDPEEGFFIQTAGLWLVEHAVFSPKVEVALSVGER
jgi:hypothetical protein